MLTDLAAKEKQEREYKATEKQYVISEELFNQLCDANTAREMSGTSDYDDACCEIFEAARQIEEKAIEIVKQH